MLRDWRRCARRALEARRAPRSGAIAAGFAALALLAPARAAADTEEGFYYSDDAALMGGAVTAWTRDAGAVWYNPAGLGGEVRSQLTLNGTVYALKIRKIPDALRTTLPGVGPRSIDLSSSDIMSAPHATAFVFSLSERVSIGLGIYITQRDVRTASNVFQIFAPAGAELGYDANLRQHLDVALELTKYELGPAVGWQIADNFRVGARAFLTYTKISGLAVYEIDATGTSGQPPATAFLFDSQHATISELGVVGMVGAQWDPATAWHLGVTLRSPEVRFSQSVDGNTIGAGASVAPGATPSAAIAFEKVSDPDGAGVTVPPRGVLGVAYDVSDRVRASIEGDLLPAVSDASTGLSTRTVVNGRAGVSAKLSEKFVAGLGVFSDRDRVILGPDFTDERIDRYGVTAGLQLLTPFTLHGENGPRPGGLVLASTLALRYAAGLGEVRALDVDTVTDASSTRVVGVLFHEFTPYIGTAVSF